MDINNKQYIEQVIRGDRRLQKPVRCPDEVFAITTRCHTLFSRDRPTFGEIYKELLFHFKAVLGGDDVSPRSHSQMSK